MKMLAAGVTGAVLTFLAAPVLATDAPAVAPAPEAALAKPSVETTPVGDLLANPATKAVLEKDFPALVSYPGIDQVKGMTLRAISKVPQANLDDTKLATIQTDLNAVK